MKCPNWGKILAAAALCAALCLQQAAGCSARSYRHAGNIRHGCPNCRRCSGHHHPPAPTDTTVPTILPQTADAGRSYVDDTLFIGDSNTVRYTMYADDTGTAFSTLKNNIGVVSMGAGSITTLKCEKFKGDSTLYTIPDAVAKLQPKRIIIGFGSNNLGGQLHGCHQVHRTVPGGAGRHHQSVALCGYYRQRHSPAGPAAGQHQPDHDPGRCLQRRSCDNVRGGRLQIFEHRRSAAG